MIRRVLHPFLILTLAGALVFGIAEAREPDGRPTVGLVLGGGAAKGLSHVGVLQVLEDNQIPVDVIAGTSIGAVVGSLYASGYSTDEISQIATELDWNKVFADDTERAQANFRRKSDDFGFLTDFKISFRDGKLVLPTGLIEGQSLYLELSRLLTRSYAVNDFDDLARPFRAVATDLSTGAPVVMGDGNLVSAVFASMAIPGFIPPVERDGSILVDGAFSNNLPVDQVRDMGADIVIVVNLGADPRPAEDLGNIVDVIRQLQILLTIDNTTKQLGNMRSGDILIEPALKEVGITGFNKADLAVRLGAESTEKSLPQLQKLRLDDASWVRYKANTDTFASAPPRIDRVKISQDTKLSDKILRAGLSIKPGDVFDAEQLNADIEGLYDDGVFNRIKYQLVQDGDENVLEISATAKESADGFFRFGLALDSNLEDESSFKLGVSYTKPQINRWGAELRGEINIGDRTDARAEFYQPIGAKQDFFIEPSLLLSRQKDDFFDDTGRRRGRLTATVYGASLQGGLLLGRWGELRTGVERARADLNFSDTSLGFDGFNINDSNVFARFTVDTLDDLAFPRHGEIFIAQFSHHENFLGGDARYDDYEITGLKPITIDRHTLVLAAEFSGSSGAEANVLGTSNLGGFLSLSGFSQDELVGRYAAMASGTYFYRLNEQAPLFDAPFFIGGSVEAGNVYQTYDDIALDNVIYAGSIFAGADSPLGPIFLGFGFNDEGRQSLYFKIGSFF